MRSNNKTLHFTAINVAYFAAYSSAHAYAAVFLLDRGFSNTAIGLILALANVLSVILQPVTAGLIDKYEAFTNRRVSMVCALACALCCSCLYFLKAIPVIFVVYVVLYMLQMLYQPLIQAMNFEYIAKGAKINFGLARGLGSCGFAVTSLIIGKLLVKNGVSVLQIVNVLMFLFGALMLLLFLAPKGEENEKPKQEEISEDMEMHNSIIEFIKCYPMFMLFVLGGTFLFFAHNALNDYLIQIITPLGGDEAIMGQMVMVAALLELPAMASFAFAQKKVGLKTLLYVSGIMFSVKTILMLVATNVFVAYLSQMCQMFAYALFIPGGAYLAERVMSKSDKTKGQAYVNCAITLGGVFSALVCGRILDVLGVHSMLLVSTVIGLIGTVLLVISIRNMKLD